MAPTADSVGVQMDHRPRTRLAALEQQQQQDRLTRVLQQLAPILLLLLQLCLQAANTRVLSRSTMGTATATSPTSDLPAPACRAGGANSHGRTACTCVRSCSVRAHSLAYCFCPRRAHCCHHGTAHAQGEGDAFRCTSAAIVADDDDAPTRRCHRCGSERNLRNGTVAAAAATAAALLRSHSCRQQLSPAVLPTAVWSGRGRSVRTPRHTGSRALPSTIAATTSAAAAPVPAVAVTACLNFFDDAQTFGAHPSALVYNSNVPGKDVPAATSLSYGAYPQQQSQPLPVFGYPSTATGVVQSSSLQQQPLPQPYQHQYQHPGLSYDWMADAQVFEQKPFELIEQQQLQYAQPAPFAPAPSRPAQLQIVSPSVASVAAAVSPAHAAAPGAAPSAAPFPRSGGPRGFFACSGSGSSRGRAVACVACLPRGGFAGPRPAASPWCCCRGGLACVSAGSRARTCACRASPIAAAAAVVLPVSLLLLWLQHPRCRPPPPSPAPLPPPLLPPQHPPLLPPPLSPLPLLRSLLSPSPSSRSCVCACSARVVPRRAKWRTAIPSPNC